jgi:hypothetical protein
MSANSTFPQSLIQKNGCKKVAFVNDGMINQRKTEKCYYISVCPDLHTRTEIVSTPRLLRLERGGQATLPCKVRVMCTAYRIRVHL